MVSSIAKTQRISTQEAITKAAVIGAGWVDRCLCTCPPPPPSQKTSGGIVSSPCRRLAFLRPHWCHPLTLDDLTRSINRIASLVWLRSGCPVAKALRPIFDLITCSPDGKLLPDVDKESAQEWLSDPVQGIVLSILGPVAESGIHPIANYVAAASLIQDQAHSTARNLRGTVKSFVKNARGQAAKSHLDASGQFKTAAGLAVTLSRQRLNLQLPKDILEPEVASVMMQLFCRHKDESDFSFDSISGVLPLPQAAVSASISSSSAVEELSNDDVLAMWTTQVEEAMAIA